MKKKLRTIILSKKLILALLLLCVIVTTLVCVPKMVSGHSPRPKYTIVIDAGHGGRDDGCEGLGGTKESVVNLAIARALEKYTRTLGIDVVMTRLDGNGLYAADADNFKVSDMEARVKIIEQAKPDMVISIHCNAYADHTQNGAQVFYQEGNIEGEKFAESVQMELHSILGTTRVISPGDYYLLSETKYPSIIVECGYLTNAEEEMNLNKSDYQNKVAYAIMCGIVKYFELCGNC